jgi:hypothetical protein
MITTYTEITPLEGLQLLVDNGGKPVKGLAFKDLNIDLWTFGILAGIRVQSNRLPFITSRSCGFKNCAKVSELDPCNAPEGCAPLEPHMAYVGTKEKISRNWRGGVFQFPMVPKAGQCAEWVSAAWIGLPDRHYAIDVRTAWAQEHYPEHCEQRAYRGDIHACRAAAKDLIIAGGKGELKRLLAHAANITEYRGNLDELRAEIEAYVTPVQRGDIIACWNALLAKRAIIDPSDLKKWLGGAIDLASYKGNYDELREKIEAYEPPAPEVKPDPFQAAWQKHLHGGGFHNTTFEEDLRHFYELGQLNGREDT